MAVGQGFSKVVTSGSVFWYDTGDMINSFPGKFGTNILAGIIRNYNGTGQDTYSNGKLFRWNGYTETVNIPALGNRTVESVEVYNVYSGYGEDGNYNCCPSLFNYSNGWLNTPLSGSTVYMYEIVYKCESGYTNPNYMYHYEYRADNTYNTEFGVHDNSRRISLGDGWYYAWGEFTTQPTTAKGYFGLWYYYYNVPDKVSIASISLQQGNSILPPRQIIPTNTTRTAVQSLLDLTGNYTIDLSNISFDSTGDISFDGTNDFIDTNFPAMTINNPTIEAVVYRSTNTGRYEAIIQNNVASDDALYVYPGGGLGFWPCALSSLAVPTGQWSYVAVSYDGTNLIFCVNGTTQTITATCADITDWDFLRIGAYGAGDGERWIGKIAVSKVYNRPLSAGEFMQNYNHYKTRFNLP
jgi:hypothetical protein